MVNFFLENQKKNKISSVRVKGMSSNSLEDLQLY